MHSTVNKRKSGILAELAAKLLNMTIVVVIVATFTGVCGFWLVMRYRVISQT